MSLERMCSISNLEEGNGFGPTPRLSLDLPLRPEILSQKGLETAALLVTIPLVATACSQAQVEGIAGEMITRAMAGVINFAGIRIFFSGLIENKKVLLAFSVLAGITGAVERSTALGGALLLMTRVVINANARSEERALAEEGEWDGDESETPDEDTE